MDAVHVDPGGEKIGIAGEAHGREIAAVASAPKTDALSVDVGAGLQIFSSGDDVLIFAGAATGAIGSFAESATVADAAAIVDGENDVAAIGEILIHRVGIRVVVHVMPAEEHLAHGAAVNEDERGAFFAGL